MQNFGYLSEYEKKFDLCESYPLNSNETLNFCVKLIRKNELKINKNVFELEIYFFKDSFYKYYVYQSLLNLLRKSADNCTVQYVHLQKVKLLDYIINKYDFEGETLKYYEFECGTM